MDIEGQAKQNQFAILIGVSEAAVSNYVQTGILNKGGTHREWLLAYCKRQRLQASNQGGERQTDLAQARINDLEAKAKLNNLKYYREVNELIPTAAVAESLTEWAVFANREYTTGIKEIFISLETEHSISLDKNFINKSTNLILKRISSFAEKKAASLMEGIG